MKKLRKSALQMQQIKKMIQKIKLKTINFNNIFINAIGWGHCTHFNCIKLRAQIDWRRSQLCVRSRLLCFVESTSDSSSRYLVFFQRKWFCCFFHSFLFRFYLYFFFLFYDSSWGTQVSVKKDERSIKLTMTKKKNKNKN